MKLLQQFILREISEGHRDLSWIVDNLRKSTTFSAAQIMSEIRTLIRTGVLQIINTVHIMDYCGQPLYTSEGRPYCDYTLELIAIPSRLTEA